jgi:nucleoside phosphorylase
MPDEYDVFLSHSSADKPAVEAVAVRLRDEAGLRPFLDAWHLVPGEPWMPALERALARSTAIAVFFGSRGMGPWHEQESRLALILAAEERGKRVIPVLLPGAGRQDVGGFMRLRTWIDLAQGSGFAALVAGITGRAPGPGAGPPSNAGLEATPVAPSGRRSDVDVLVITALKEELDALLEVTAGLREPWADGQGGDIPYRIATVEGRRGPIRVAAARTTRTAGVATATVATRLADLLKPGCLAMCGVCAGHPEDTDLGDVVIADRVFHHDQGKLRPGAFEGDLWVHSLRDAWLRAAQDLAGPAVGLHGYVTADDEAGRWWFLEQLLAGRDPLRSSALRRHVPDDRRAAILQSLRDELGYVSLAGKTFSLTDAGRDAGQEREILHGTLVTQRPYHIHVGPMGSGNPVVADGLVWGRLASHGMRKALAVEMEAAAVGQVAHERSLPFVVIKGVMDHADEAKSDRFKRFAARASAEVLLELLRRVVTGGASRPTRDEGPSIEPMPAQAEEDVGDVSEERLVEELATVLWDPERARSVALAAGFGPGNIPVMKLARVFWSRIIEDARNGAIQGRARAVADAAAREVPHNAIFRSYRGT